MEFNRFINLGGSLKEGNSIFNLRLRVLMIMGFISSPFLVAISINHYLNGRIVTCILLSIILIFTLSNSILIFRKKRLAFPFSFCYLFFLIIIIWAFYSAGEVVAFWCYPLAFGSFFVFEHRKARLVTCISILCLVPIAFLWMDTGFAIRFTATYLLSCFIADLAISLVDDLQERLTSLVVTDPLTQAFNRRHLEGCLTQFAEESDRGFGLASIIALDIDYFKKINDNFGHQEGDAILKNLVAILTDRKRQLDLVFRTGGDEFMILVKNNSLDQTLLFAETLRANVEKVYLGAKEAVTISLGVVQYQKGESVGEWLQRADVALYESKRSGRNRVSLDKKSNFTEPDMSN